MLATDSASTVIVSGDDGAPRQVSTVYNNASKVFQICKDLPIGAITWGSGSIGVASISTLMKDLRAVSCDMLTLGQYLAPTLKHIPVARYVPPEEFDALAALARTLGFAQVASGPFVRSSYFAETLFAETDILRGA